MLKYIIIPNRQLINQRIFNKFIAIETANIEFPILYLPYLDLGELQCIVYHLKKKKFYFKYIYSIVVLYSLTNLNFLNVFKTWIKHVIILWERQNRIKINQNKWVSECLLTKLDGLFV